MVSAGEGVRGTGPQKLRLRNEFPADVNQAAQERERLRAAATAPPSRTSLRVGEVQRDSLEPRASSCVHRGAANRFLTVF